METFIQYFYLPMAAILVGLGGFFTWAAHQVHYRGRVQLIRLGSVALPGAELLKSQFALLFLLEAIASLGAAIVILVLHALQPGVFLFVAVSVALAFRRSMLVSGLEKYASSVGGEA